MRFSNITCEVYGTFTLSAAGPLLIKSTESTKLTPETADALFLRSGTGDGKDAFVIPGSSIKGVVRHYLETAPDVPKLIHTSDRNAFWTELFGSVKKPAYKSKISFSDAFADMDTIETTIRYQTKIDAVAQGAASGSLNSIQAVTKGDFPCSYRICNLNADELAVFAKAMAAFDSGELCIGGRVSRGYGRVQITDFRLVLTNGYNQDLRPRILQKCDSLEEFLAGLDDLKSMISKAR